MKQFDMFTDLVVETGIEPTIALKESKIDDEVTKYWSGWKPKDKSKLGKVNHSKKLIHGWLMSYLVGIDAYTNKRWEYWLKLQSIPPTAYFELRTKGLTDKFISQAIHCHDYPQITFSEDKKTSSYLQSVIDLITGDGAISCLDAFEFLIDWLLYGLGHEDFTTLPKSPSRTKNLNSLLYEYFDLFPFLHNPYDYLGLLLPQLYGQNYKGKVGFFPTPMTICTAISEILNSSNKPSIETFIEPSAGTGTIALAQSNFNLCATTIELSLICTKASLVNFYLYAPQYARPIWYLADRNDLFCGNTLSGEMNINYHSKYKQILSENLNKEWAIA